MELKDLNRSSRTVVAQFASYNNVDSDGDISTQGMFTKSINENFGRIKHLLNHDTCQAIGVPARIWDDANGAYLESKIGTHSLGEDFLKMAADGIITEHSFGFQVVKDQESPAGNKLLEVKLWEVSSLTAWGANQYTPLISVTKGVSKEDQIARLEKRMKVIDRFVKSTDVTDETVQLLLLEIKQMGAALADLMQGTPPSVKGTKPHCKDDGMCPDCGAELDDSGNCPECGEDSLSEDDAKSLAVQLKLYNLKNLIK